MTKHLKNPHPGEILQEEFLEPLGMSQNALAQAIGVPSNRINELVRGRRGVTADTDLRLARYFGLSEGYWLRLQNSYDMMEARREAGKAIARIKPRPMEHQEGGIRGQIFRCHDLPYKRQGGDARLL